MRAAEPLATPARRPRVHRPFPVRARRWARANLFSNGWNTLLTLVAALIVGYAVYHLLRFVLVTGEWDVIEANRRLIFLGRFPASEEWRIWPVAWYAGALGGLSIAAWGGLPRREALLIAVPMLAIYAWLARGMPAVLLAVAAALGVAMYLGGRAMLRPGTAGDAAADAADEAPDDPRARWTRRALIAMWLGLIPFTVLMLAGVRTTLWGGLLLNLMIASVAIAACFPFGVLLALGRTSSYPAIRIVCTVYIEVIRGAPLIAWLLMARFVLPSFLPTTFDLDSANIVIRAIMVFTVFTAAYVAEIVRGGLQSIPRGQREAAEALGLGALNTTLLIVLPQALRTVIPALVGQFIALFKDTSLVFVLSLTDLLGASEAAVRQREFFGRHMEVLLFASLLFWLGSFTMSRISQRIERNMGLSPGARR